MTVDRDSRFRGCLLGLAIGDAVGTSVEFKPPGTFSPVDDMIGGGPFALKPGEWTDDTSMALCLADSLIECRDFDPRDQMNRYLRWWHEGYLSSNGRCFDIGGTVREALTRFEQMGEPFAGSMDRHSAGNGSLMRLAPVPLFFANEPAEAVRMSGESSRITHGATMCVDACRYFGALIVGACNGVGKDELLRQRYEPNDGLWQNDPLCVEIDEIACGSFKHKQPPAIVGSGYVVQSLEAALWAFHNSSNFKEGCLMAVNLGNDADTTAAIFGQLAGAYYGDSELPPSWREQLAHEKLIVDYAVKLARSSLLR